MSFELLANELLIDLFEYLSSVDLFHGFNGLNYRFDGLLKEYFRSHKHLDFRFALKEDLNVIRRRYLPLFIEQINSICLSDDDINPHEIDLFLSRIFPLYRFTNLQSISLYNIYSIQKLIRILDDLQRISHLTHLNLNQCQIVYNPKNIVYIINTIWSFPKLTHCSLDISYDCDCYLITPTIISCSLQYVSISGVRCGLNNLSLLSEHTPYLEYLSVNIDESVDDCQPLSVIPSLTTLNFNCEASSKLILSLLRKIPNLNKLTVETKVVNIDGKKWEDIIKKYLPNLKIFNLKMNFILSEYDEIEGEIDRIVDSYRTPFWIDQHKWFIRCFYTEQNDHGLINFHTLPYDFQHFYINVNDNERFLFKSTCPDDNHYLLYNHVQNLDYCYMTSEDINRSKIQFLNIQYLTLTLPYDYYLQSFVPRLDNLLSLKIRMTYWGDNDNDLLQLQTIIDQAPRLYHLTFLSWSSRFSKNEHKKQKTTNTTAGKMAPFLIGSLSVRHLDLRGTNGSNETHYYNTQDCSTLIRSPLGIQCQMLLIEVEKRTNIIDLVNKMPNLRALNVRCRDRKKNDDEIIKWLQSHLPSTCTIAKDSRFSSDIRLWIR